MPISFQCSHCGRTLRAPDDAAGKKVRCPKCQEVTRIPQAEVEAEPVAIPAIPEQEEQEETQRDDEDEREPCPMCGELIIANAAKCRYCGEIFDKELKRLERKKKGKSRDTKLTVGDWVVAILCSWIGCIAGIVWMIQGKPKGLKMFGVSMLFTCIWAVIRLSAELAGVK